MMTEKPRYLEFKYATLAEFARDCQAQVGNSPAYDDHSWTGESYHESIEHCFKGRLDRIKEAESMMDQLSAQLDDSASLWTKNVAGAFPLVPEFLAGEPEHMRCKTYQPSRNVPIRVFAGVAASAGVSWQDMETRGITIMALLLKLLQERPVEAYIYDNSGRSGNPNSIICMIQMPLQPLQLSLAYYMLTSQGLVRNVLFSMINKHGFDGGWGSLWNVSKPDNVEPLRQAMGLRPDDLILPPVYLTNTPIFKQPLKWLNENLAKCRLEQTYEAAA